LGGPFSREWARRELQTGWGFGRPIFRTGARNLPPLGGVLGGGIPASGFPLGAWGADQVLPKGPVATFQGPGTPIHGRVGGGENGGAGGEGVAGTGGVHIPLGPGNSGGRTSGGAGKWVGGGGQTTRCYRPISGQPDEATLLVGAKQPRPPMLQRRRGGPLEQAGHLTISAVRRGGESGDVRPRPISFFWPRRFVTSVPRGGGRSRQAGGVPRPR